MTDNLAARPNAIISPRPNARVYDQAISIFGTIDVSASDPPLQMIQAWIDKSCIGQTRIFSQTSSEQCQLTYHILGRFPERVTAPRSAIIALTLCSDTEKEGVKIGEVQVELIPARLHERHYGEVLSPDQAAVLHRENIYGSGPPIEQASPQMLELILGYLSPGSSIVDVGCGAGAFARGLIDAGHKCMGLEVSDQCIELLKRRGLPYRKVTDPTPHFPCADREFDQAICIEVLEHIENTGPFLSEIARVIRGRALFSVPNLEVLPYLKDWDTVPWHLLEGSHVNFFTRTSLRNLLERHFARVEVFSYAEHPLRTRDEISLHGHLFAIATA